ncbi:MAG TPA: hemerythrin domain-containing protein [Kofleriaceae bacterium]|jgi:hemerythrin superfamily protein|nr:hemerythrin domain-containing protein [Kofleriaceae bacterium]
MKNAETLDVLDLLSSQHDEVDALIAKIEKGDDDRDARFAELADKLAAHASVEEKIFYPAAFQESTSEMLHEAVEEHLVMKRTLADMLELDCDSDEFEAKLSVLKEQVTHHAREEEEGKLFPKLRKSMNAETRAALGNEVLAMFEALMKQEPRRNVPNETEEAAPLPG